MIIFDFFLAKIIIIFFGEIDADISHWIDANARPVKHSSDIVAGKYDFKRQMRSQGVDGELPPNPENLQWMGLPTPKLAVSVDSKKFKFSLMF